MTIDMSQFYQTFFDEAGEHLASMEALLLGLHVDQPSLDDLNAIFRAAHSIKGGAGTFGFTDLTGVTHILENLLDRLRKEELALTTTMVDAFLAAGDVLKGQLEAHKAGTLSDPAAAVDICKRLESLTSGGAALASAHAQPASSSGDPVALAGKTIGHLLADVSDAVTSVPGRAQITFQTAAGKGDLEKLWAGLREMGSLEIRQRPVRKGRTRDYSGQWEIEVVTSASESALRDIFEFLIEAKDLSIRMEPAAGASHEASAAYGFFEDVPAPGAVATAAPDAGYGFFEEIPSPVTADPGYGFFQPVQAAVTAASETPTGAGHPPPGQPNITGIRSARRDAGKAVSAPVPSSESSSIRVSVEKVDQLINLVGELVITQSMIAQMASKVDPVVYEGLMNGLGQFERNTRDLQESVMSIRMMPIAFVFSRFPRVVRDLASKLNKKVELKTVGEGTELDKGVIEKIADPLTHLVRNSLDHGVELPEQRLAAGKPETGTITLSAYHQSGNIVVEVADDGGGLSREKILRKAMERGMAVSDTVSDQEVWQLIFEAGFSTAEVVTDVSGRGVGMDVVKRNIRGMGGRIEIDSALGAGTKIRIRLPLTLAILDGMSVAIGGELFIVPLTVIIESLRPQPPDITSVQGTGMVIKVRGEYLPVIALHEILGVRPKHTDPAQGIMIIVESEGRKVAMLVDELVGQHQVVIKSLESNYRKVPGCSGATIMGDGRVALILDVATLVGTRALALAA
ncbi:MAG: chemotaxis protein CheW [Burkholderiales bacterium]